MQIYRLNEKSKKTLTLPPGADTPSYATKLWEVLYKWSETTIVYITIYWSTWTWLHAYRISFLQ